MKKNVLALSITAAVVGLGFAGGAQAMTSLGGASANSELRLNGDGVGHMLLVPYYSAQAENATLINLVNTDTANGKAVKVRFRGAANSDDVFDFQVFLSPGDVYAFNISKNSAGLAQISTTDNSCTKPAKAVLTATPFVTSRLDSTLDAGGKANGTREGYVEIFNMGDIPKSSFTSSAAYDAGSAAGRVTSATNTDNGLFTAIKHVAKVAPCSGAAWTYLDDNNLAFGNSNAAGTSSFAGLTAPTTGLMANWTIINVVGAAAWSNSAVAVEARTVGTAVAARGNVVYWPQTGVSVGSTIDSFTADPLLRSANVSRFNTATLAYVVDAIPAVAAAYYDLPDMSTPYTAVATSPMSQAVDLTAAIAATSATNEFLTDQSIQASTDWVFSMPTRRYNISLDYAAIAAGDDGRRFTDLFANSFATGYFLQQNTLVTSRQICVRGITVTTTDREETSLLATQSVVVSPSTPADPLTFCGEASVLSINRGGVSGAGTGALKAQVSVKDIDVGFVDGWMRIATPSATAVPFGPSGLPVLGSAFSKASAGPNSFGITHMHRLGR